MNDLKIHPIADIFPMMSPDEFASLKNDIRDKGLVQPVWLYEDRILDGRNRAKACLELGIDPVTCEYRGEDPIGFAVSLNKERRHLTTSQLACIAVEALPVYEAEAKKRQVAAGGDRKSDNYQNSVSQKVDEPIDTNENKSTAKAAQALGTNRQYVSDAKKLQSEDPEVFSQVKAGELTLREANKKLEPKSKSRKKPIETTVTVVKDAVSMTPADFTDEEFLTELQQRGYRMYPLGGYDGTGHLGDAIAGLYGVSPKSSALITELTKEARLAIGIESETKRRPPAMQLAIFNYHYHKLQSNKQKIGAEA